MNDEREKLLDYIVEYANKDWIDFFIHDVIEYDWVSDLHQFDTEILKKWAEELGYSPTLDPKDELTCILEDATFKGIITCPECGNHLEPDAEKCSCGWINPLLGMGLI